MGIKRIEKVRKEEIRLMSSVMANISKKIIKTRSHVNLRKTEEDVVMRTWERVDTER